MILSDNDECSILCSILQSTNVSHLKDIDNLSNEFVQICLHASDKSTPCTVNEQKDKAGIALLINLETMLYLAYMEVMWVTKCGSQNVGH